MNIAFVYPRTPSDQHRAKIRCQNLAEAILRTGRNKAHKLDLAAFACAAPEANAVCAEADILVIYKHFYGRVLNAAHFWQARDKKVIVDLDEALDLLPADMPQHALWMEGQDPGGLFLPSASSAAPETPLEQFRWGIRMADAVSVPTLRLADDWSSLTRVLCIPDYINTDEYRVLKKSSTREVHIGIRGDSFGASALESAGLLAALERVCFARPETRLHFFYFQPELVESLRVSPRQKRLYAWEPEEKWPASLAGIDICLLPVGDEYGFRSSPVQALECMAMKTPWLASDLPPYRELARFGQLVPNAAEYWEPRLLDMIDHLETYRREAAGEAFLYALGQDIFENIPKVFAAYASIL